MGNTEAKATEVGDPKHVVKNEEDVEKLTISIDGAEEKESESLYAVLGVPKDASHSEILAAFRKLIPVHDPTHMEGRGETVTPEHLARWERMSSAYKTLKDEEKRKVYDEKGFVDSTQKDIDEAMSEWKDRIAAAMSREADVRFKGSDR